MSGELFRLIAYNALDYYLTSDRHLAGNNIFPNRQNYNFRVSGNHNREQRVTEKKRLAIKFVIYDKTSGDDVCCICLDEYKRGDEIYVTECNHVFHKNCTLEHIKHSRDNTHVCPLCRHVNVLNV